MRSSLQPLNRQGKGFTLVELMVVIAIILVLMAASVGVVFKFLSSQKQAATQRTVDQVNAAIERVLKNIRTNSQTNFTSSAIKSPISDMGINLQALGIIGLKEPIRRDMLTYVDLQIARSFPQSFASIDSLVIPVNFEPLVDSTKKNNLNLSFNSVMGQAKYSSLTSNFKAISSLVQARKGLSQPSSSQIENSACLLMALEANPDGLKGENLGSAIMTDSTSGVRYLATGDGQPIGFQLRYLDSASGGSKSVVGTVTLELIVP